MKRTTRREAPALRLARMLQAAHLDDYCRRRPHHQPPRTEADERNREGIAGWLALAEYLIRHGVRVPPEGQQP